MSANEWAIFIVALFTFFTLGLTIGSSFNSKNIAPEGKISWTAYNKLKDELIELHVYSEIDYKAFKTVVLMLRQLEYNGDKDG